MKSPDADTGFEITELQLPAENRNRRFGARTGPLRRLQAYLQGFMRSGREPRIGIQAGDKVEELASAFDQSGADRSDGRQNPEDQVEARLRDLERQSRLLKAAAAVGQAATNTLNLDLLLSRITILIHEHFPGDHASIYLIEAENEPAVLRASSSKVSQQMLAAGQALRAEETSLVDAAARARQPLISLDGGAEAVQFKLPYLPDTRCEIALPLISGDRLWGVLDIQSNQAAAFRDEDLGSLQILADQVAIAIENAQHFQASQATIQELRTAIEASRHKEGEHNRDSWQELLRARPVQGYVCKLRDVGAPQSSAELMAVNGHVDLASDEASEDLLQPVSGSWHADMIAAGQCGTTIQVDEFTVVIPIKIRERVAGAVRLRKPENANAWTEQEIALMETLSDQLSVALESAQLYEDTRRRAERERLTSEITAKVRASNDPQVILSTAVSELRRALQASRAQVRLHSIKKPNHQAPQAPSISAEVKSGNDAQTDIP